MSRLNREKAFAEKIDCHFPYHDWSQAASLIEEAWSISENAAFLVLYEIVQPPHSSVLTEKIQTKLSTLWMNGAESSHAKTTGALALRMLAGSKLTFQEVLTTMSDVASSTGRYAALAVLTSLAYSALEGDALRTVDEMERQIRKRWDEAGSSDSVIEVQ